MKFPYWLLLAILFINNQYVFADNYDFYNFKIYKQEKIKTVDSLSSLRNQIEILKNKGDYREAEFILKKEIHHLKLKKHYKKLFYAYMYLIDIYNITQKKPNQIPIILQRLDNLVSTNSFNLVKIFNLNNLKGICFSEKNLFNFKKSKKFYTANIILAKKLTSKKALYLTYNNLANLYIKVKNDSAKYFINKALVNATSIRSKNYCYYNLATYFLKNKELKSALININLSLDQLPKQVKYFYRYLISNSKKSEIYNAFFIKTANKKYLEKSLALTLESDSIINQIIERNIAIKSKLFWSEEASNIYANGVFCTKILNNVKLSYYFFEKNKAVVLRKNKQNRKLNKRILPKKLYQEENNLSKKIFMLEDKLKQQEKDTFFNELSKLKIKRKILIDSIYSLYPIYKKINKKQEIISLKKTQEKLQNNEVFISYLWNTGNKNHCFVLYIGKHNTLLQEINNSEQLSKQIDSLYQLLQTPQQTKRDLEKFQKTSYMVYKQLFSDKSEVFIKTKKLLISPDNKLQFIPFEVLINKKNSNNYLLYQYQISYLYSYTFLEKNQNQKPKINFGGFVPVTFNYDSLTPLRQSKQELLNINKIIKGTNYIGIKATKKAFLKNAEQYNILHIASHASADKQEEPWLAFYDKKLKLHELYTTTLNANLVNISSCYSSIGEIAPGEGLLSLSRGFFFAGSQSVVSSLWQVNDWSSKEIMSDFYKQIKNGESKASALRHAKLRYLKNNSLSDISPYYWASFILTGDSGTIPMVCETHHYTYFILIFISLLSISILTYWRRKQKKQA